MKKGAMKIVAGCCIALLALPSAAEYKETLIERSQAWGVAVADYNRDGHDDIFITGHDSNDRIWYWTPTGYVASSQTFALPDRPDRHDCAPADVNLDGRMDFYCAIGAEKGTGTGNNELWIQRPNGKHQMVGTTTDFGAKDPYGRGRIPIFFDFNRDGYPDLFVTNMAVERIDGQPNVNRVFVNEGGAFFSERVTIATGMFGSTCVAKGDIDQDGWEDVLICADEGAPRLYRNNRLGDFAEEALPAVTAANAGPGTTDLRLGDWNDAKLTDMNGDGRDDLVLLTRTNRMQVWLNSGRAPYFDTLAFEDALPFSAPSLAISDFDRDGQKDIYVVLADDRCNKTGRDIAPDVVYKGRSSGRWERQQLVQDYRGCGRLAEVLDGYRVLLVNGGGSEVGPNYVLDID